MTIDRILKVIDFYGLTKSSLERELALSNGYLGKMASRNGDVGVKVIEKILYKFPDISLTWLITGEGNMLAEKSNGFDNTAKEPVVEYLPAKTSIKCEQCQLRERLLEAKEETIQALRAIIRANNIKI